MRESDISLCPGYATPGTDGAHGTIPANEIGELNVEILIKKLPEFRFCFLALHAPDPLSLVLTRRPVLLQRHAQRAVQVPRHQHAVHAHRDGHDPGPVPCYARATRSPVLTLPMLLPVAEGVCARAQILASTTSRYCPTLPLRAVRY
eukprot:2244578-Rhodomonas_salina.5